MQIRRAVTWDIFFAKERPDARRIWVHSKEKTRVGNSHLPIGNNKKNGGVTFEQICVGKNTLAIGQKGEYSENPNPKNEKKTQRMQRVWK